MNKSRNLTKQHKRRLRLRGIVARAVDFAMHRLFRTKIPQETEQFQKDLSKMTSWQNSQWLRAGAHRADTARFLAMARRAAA